MAKQFNIGIDLGSNGCRAAYVENGKVTVLPTDLFSGSDSQWLFLHHTPDEWPVVHFPSIKPFIGGEFPKNSTALIDSPDILIRDTLQDIRHAVKVYTGQTPLKAVIAVPARFPASNRAALREIALSIGFKDVHLINDSTAAVIARSHEQDESRTVLVFSMGYSGYEVSLIRVAKKEYYRALGYDGGEAPSGEFFDRIIIGSILKAFQQHQTSLQLQGLNLDQWYQLRRKSEQMKMRLSVQDSVDLRIGTVTPRGRAELSLQLGRNAFEQALAKALSITLDGIEKLIEDADMSIAHLADIYLVGGTTKMPYVQGIIQERFQKRPVPPSDDLLAIGAAIYASRLTDQPQPEKPVEETTEAFLESKELTVESSSMAVSMMDAAEESRSDVISVDLFGSSDIVGNTPSARSGGPGGLERPDRNTLFRYTRHLIDQKSYEQAEGFLLGLIQDAEAMLEEVKTLKKPKNRQEVEKVLSRAYQLIVSGEYEEAVKHAHYAFHLDPEDSETFQKMIDIHCQAAEANTTPELYEESIKWLMCAHSHDQTNAEVLERLANRHFLHAQQMNEQKKYNEALAALEECLRFDPEHEEGNALLEATQKMQQKETLKEKK